MKNKSREIVKREIYYKKKEEGGSHEQKDKEGGIIGVKR